MLFALNAVSGSEDLSFTDFVKKTIFPYVINNQDKIHAQSGVPFIIGEDQIEAKPLAPNIIPSTIVIDFKFSHTSSKDVKILDIKFEDLEENSDGEFVFRYKIVGYSHFRAAMESCQLGIENPIICIGTVNITSSEKFFNKAEKDYRK